MKKAKTAAKQGKFYFSYVCLLVTSCVETLSLAKALSIERHYFWQPLSNIASVLMSSCPETNPQALKVLSYHLCTKQQLKNQ
jgi:hypothetical protein